MPLAFGNWNLQIFCEVCYCYVPGKEREDKAQEEEWLMLDREVLGVLGLVFVELGLRACIGCIKPCMAEGKGIEPDL